MKPDSTIREINLERLRVLDGCTLSNAVERLRVRPRNEGFISGLVRCRFKTFPPMVGYAVTGRIRSSFPPMHGRCYYDRIDFWRYLASLPRPQVMVLQDVDPHPGLGAFVGEMHATIGRALGCIGYVTNGSVRDLPALKALGFYAFSGSVAVSHAYAHLAEFGEPVDIGGLKISSGDLLHGDQHGLQKIPREIAGKLPEEAEKVIALENQLKEFCKSERFSLDALEEKLKAVELECL
jgi:4-hydroxy-4-methyl-2-oxoglutarate aldolase